MRWQGLFLELLREKSLKTKIVLRIMYTSIANLCTIGNENTSRQIELRGERYSSAEKMLIVEPKVVQ